MVRLLLLGLIEMFITYYSQTAVDSITIHHYFASDQGSLSVFVERKGVCERLIVAVR